MPIQYHSLSVLVADDFSSFRNTVNGMLLGLGVQKIAMASNGEEVIERCARQSFDVILCDYDLGAGRNGQHVLEELRYKKLISWQTLFIMVSAEASRNIVMSAYDCEPDDYLMKPISARMLQRRMARLIDLREKLSKVHKALDMGNDQHAVDLLIDMSLADDRYSSPAQKMLGELFLRLGELNKAEKLYTKALEVRQLDWARLGLAKVKQRMGELDVAGKWLNRIVDDNPLYLPAYDVLADNWEEQGDTNESQNTVQKAVDVSPMSILRQKRLAVVAQVNGDTHTALEALRKSVRLGRLSCHGTAQDSVNFAKLVVDAHGEGTHIPETTLHEAMDYMETAKKNYSISDELGEEFERLEQTVQAIDEGRPVPVHEPIEEEEPADLFKGLPETTQYDIEADLNEVGLLLSMGEEERAQALLEELKIKYEHDQKALEMLDAFLDEPVSETNIELVSTVNREGISLYSEGRYDEALECFEKARKLFPKHIGIQLNIAQCLIGKLKVDANNEQVFSSCEDSLNIVADLIDEDHPQYERYAKLRKMAVATMNDPENYPGAHYDR